MRIEDADPPKGPDPQERATLPQKILTPLLNPLKQHLPDLAILQCARREPDKRGWTTWILLGDEAPLSGLDAWLTRTMENGTPCTWEGPFPEEDTLFFRWAQKKGVSSFALHPLPVPFQNTVALLGTRSTDFLSRLPDSLLSWVLSIATLSASLQGGAQAQPGKVSEDRYRRLFLHAPDGLFLVDPVSLKILEGNPIFADMTGDFFRELLPGSSLASLWNTTEDDLHRVVDRLKKSGDPIQNQKRTLLRKDGTFLHTSANLTLIPGPEGERLLVQVRDITARVEMEGLNEIFATLDQMLLAGAPLEDLLSTLLRGIQKLFSFFSIHFCRPHPDGSLELLHSFSRSKIFEDAIQGLASRIRWNEEQSNETSVGMALRTRSTRFLEKGESGTPVLRKVFSRFNIDATVSIPVLRGEGKIPWGTITITLPRGERISPEKIAILEKIGTRISLAFERHEELSQIRLQKSAMECIPVPMAITSAGGEIEWCNDAFQKRVSSNILRMIGNVPEFLVRGGERDELARQIWNTLNGGSFFSGEIRHAAKNGDVSITDTLITAIRNEKGDIRHLILTETDISEKKRLEDILKRQAWSDGLTGLPNRTHLEILMDEAIHRSRLSGKGLAVCFLDLDGFKPVNDRLGHAFGDRILIEVSHRLQNAVRSGDTVARLGGDEFVLLLEEIDRNATIHQLLARILESIARPFEAPGTPLSLTASIGVTLYPEDLSPSDVLLRHADHALYQAKEDGRNRFVLFRPETAKTIVPEDGHLPEVFTVRSMQQKRALLLDPELDLSSGRISGISIRLDTRELDSPPDTSLDNLTRWSRYRDEQFSLLRQGLRILSDLEKEGFDQTLTIPVDARLLTEPGFLSTLDHTVQTMGLLNPSRLELALESTKTMDRPGDPAGILLRFRERGFSLCLDDCSGQSLHAMEQIRTWPLSRIRIHPSLTRDISENDKALVIFDSLVHLAQAYGQNTLAAGVEDRDTLGLILRSGARFFQGSLLSPSLAPEQLQDSLKALSNGIPGAGTLRPEPDFFLLMGTMQHQRAIRRLLELLETGRPFPYSLEEVDSPRTCYLGKWLDSHRTDRLAGDPRFQKTVRLHTHAHALTGQILRLHQSGKLQEARSLVPEILACRNSLLDTLSLFTTDSS
jgi:diguanylate cyclase (GGDEF)-like protein/PAS domain S-box-containing protein|uniref:Diguanylate cyclase/phosphodiesterase with PAS/PAC sensor(S) n=1 Tax=Leptospirillum sp. Group II '5-way CG' TaxID=419541 RepID=B6AQR3_9BACT|nr:MAG: Diguanylate cyclase/phosphodiesterase with PAS/PAC sensor(s) [Leptospirillum sp. Group II '5-way CG']